MDKNRQIPQKPKSFYHLIDKTCANFGERLFVWDKWQSSSFQPKSYANFYDDIQAFAAYLLESGFANKKIMLFSENSYYWMVTNYAIASNVGIVVAANKDWQDYDVTNALQTVNTQMVIYSEKNKSVIEKIKPVFKEIKFISMNEVAKIIKEHREQNNLNADKRITTKNIAPADQTCQIIFTTGSSGLPKAVPLTFNNVEVCFRMMLSRLPFTSKDTHYLFLPLSHVFGNMAALVSFRQGHKLYICSDTKLVKEEIKIAKPTIVCGVPLFFDRIYNGIGYEKIAKITKVARITGPLSRVGIDLRRIAFKQLYNFFGGKLKYVICGAAPLEYNVKKLFLNIGVDFVEAYGMSETCAFITMEKLGTQRANSVGIPYDDVKCKIININEFGQGEIVVKGPNVFQGYYVGDSIEKLAADEEGFFHTGDLGRFDDKGRLFLTGRKKRLILTPNGENVSPDEMEKHFSERLAIKKVKVYSIENQLAITIFAGDKEKRNDVKLRLIISHVNHSLPKFKRVRKIFIDRSDNESSVK